MPEGSGEVDLDGGTAELHAENICAVFDAFTVGNSFSPNRPLGFASGRIDSIDLKWSGVTKSFMGVHDTANHFAGDFFQIGSVTIATAFSSDALGLLRTEGRGNITGTAGGN